MKVEKRASGVLAFGLFALGLLGLAASAYAVAWPSDFWSQVSGRISAVEPSGSQVGAASNGQPFSSAAWASLSGDAFGTEERPFDSVCRLYLATSAIFLDTRPPCGIFLYFR